MMVSTEQSKQTQARAQNFQPVTNLNIDYELRHVSCSFLQSKI